MPNKMLIDATHPEETRVVVVSGNRVDEFDFESESKKPLRGNIYLAKITRVEPSLQAAFVEYGGNRHGFLAFSEIHPDYYQIPVADREALLRQQAVEARREAEAEEAEVEAEAEAAEANDMADDMDAEHHDAAPTSPHDDEEDDDEPDTESGDTSSEEAHAEEVQPAQVAEVAEAEAASADTQENAVSESDEDSASEEVSQEEATEETGEDSSAHPEMKSVVSDETVEDFGGETNEEAHDEAEPRKARHNYRNYKIQEVIKRRQIMLVQVVKEERGNKGAALTTYLSLAGRYCVLMPNTARGGGISRKITQAADRKKLKSIAESLEVPEGMGLIVRTAGAKRTKVEIKRDYEYLLRMWESVRELTLRSIAPALVYEEGNLVKRSIRDLYDKDIDSIFVEGDEGYKEAKNFMRMLMPSHAKNVQLYKDRIPLFQKYQVEQQLDSMFLPSVTLKSGGYIVINPTEALVSIDVNSGRSTKERNIEQTALRTNLEAAEEIARQMRLRDLAGLIVIDFIDMDENRNNRAVERKLKESLRSDRARIQVGRISHFGLLEMSRQRMRSGVLEGSTVSCPHCAGTGLVRSVESLTLHVIRGIEAEAAKGRGAAFTARVPMEVALYILNQKRANILDLEDRYGTSVYIEADPTLKGSEHRIELAEARALTRTRPAQGAINIESTYNAVDDAIEDEIVEQDENLATDESEDEESEAPARDRSESESESETADGQRRRRRRRRRGRGRHGNEPGNEQGSEQNGGPSRDPLAQSDSESSSFDEEGGANDDGDDDEDQPRIGDVPEFQADGEEKQRKRRRRGRRGGRRNRRLDEQDGQEDTQTAVYGELEGKPGVAALGDDPDLDDEDTEAAQVEAISEIAEESAPALRPDVQMEAPSEETTERRAPDVENTDSVDADHIGSAIADLEADPVPEPVISEPAFAAEPQPEKPAEPARRGWWQRRLS